MIGNRRFAKIFIAFGAMLFLSAGFLSTSVFPARSAAAAPKEFQDCSGCPVMVVLPPGSFMMGMPDSEKAMAGPDETPQHKVTINYSLAVGKYEVTLEEYERFAGETNRPTGNACFTMESGKWEATENRNWHNPGFPQTARHPVVCTLYDDALAYAQWLSAKTGKNYRLLSEAEWEYAARAGTTTPWFWGNDPNLACQYANTADLSSQPALPTFKIVVPCKDGYAYTAPVGSFKPNQWGLYDMLGNAWEWEEDCYVGSYNGAPADGSARHDGDCDLRLWRGGAWKCVQACDPANTNNLGALQPSASIRASNRDNDAWGDRRSNGGFRVARLAD